jgi:DNA-binding response OmpR family regulator
LIVTSDSSLAEHLLHELRTLDWIAVSVDDCDTALEMMEVVDFSLVMVDVTRERDWLTCRSLVEAKRSSVVVVTSFLADDRRYRTLAFQLGVVAYLYKLCAVGGRLCEMLRRLQRGERCVEFVDGAAHRPLDRAKLA